MPTASGPGAVADALEAHEGQKVLIGFDDPALVPADRFAPNRKPTRRTRCYCAGTVSSVADTEGVAAMIDLGPEGREILGVTAAHLAVESLEIKGPPAHGAWSYPTARLRVACRGPNRDIEMLTIGHVIKVVRYPDR